MKIIRKFLILLILGILFGACTTSQGETPTLQQSELPTLKILATDTSAPESLSTESPPPSPSPSPSPIPSTTASSTVIIQPTTNAPQTITPPPPGNSIIADHTVVDQFDRIPDEYIKKASELHFLFRHASVGWNIDNALNCLANNMTNRPNYCDRGLTTNQIIYNAKYDRSNWIFEFHSPPPGQNPGWWDKTRFFIDRINNLKPGEKFDIAGFKMGYVDGQPGSNLAANFFTNNPDDNLPSIEDIEALEAEHPELKVMYLTLALARSVGSPESASFDQQMRDYTRDHNKILFDIADIESHLPDGSPCYDNNGDGIEALCDQYTAEKEGGHLNALGSQRAAKALWWIMARLAGWDGTLTQ